MMLAVIHADAYILQRKAGDHAFREHLTDALLHSRDELRWNRAADDVVDELEAGPARQRFDAQRHFPELARPARLFLVSMMAVRRACDCFPIRNARRMRFALHAVTLAH